MDFKVKGISWMGNVYQKFEAMCLEVEDVVCQDTAKYVETQVQTVGSSVKKFYAEVLQDLLPPSSLDSKNTEDSVLSLEQNTDFGTYEKPKISVKDDSAKGDFSAYDTSEMTISTVKSEQNGEVDIIKKLKEGIEKNPIKEKLLPTKMSEGITPSGEKMRQESKHLLPPVDVVDSRLSMEQHVRNETDPLKAEVLELVTPPGKVVSRASSLDNLLEENLAKARDTQMKMNSPHREPGASCNNSVDEEVVRAADNSSASQSSHLVPSIVPCDIEVVENGLSASIDLLTDSNGAETSATFDTLPFRDSSWTEPEQFSEEKSDDEDGSELDESDGIVELASETMKEFQRTKLEESCIFVDSKEVPLVPRQAGKRGGSYKKKIRDALASRMKLAKNREYEQLAIWHGDPQLKKSPSEYDIGESEWELL